MSVTHHALLAAEAVLSKLSPTATQEDTIAALRDICDDDFFVYSFKVVPCGKSYSHKWTQCPCAHQGETARRRDPRTIPYRAVLCPLVKAKKTCPLGDSCGYAHNVFEHWLHPARYKTRLCSFGLSCNRPICFFAHTAEELRCVPNQEEQMEGRDGDEQLMMMQLMQLAGQDPAFMRPVPPHQQHLQAANAMLEPLLQQQAAAQQQQQHRQTQHHSQQAHSQCGSPMHSQQHHQHTQAHQQMLAMVAGGELGALPSLHMDGGRPPGVLGGPQQRQASNPPMSPLSHQQHQQMLSPRRSVDMDRLSPHHNMDRVSPHQHQQHFAHQQQQMAQQLSQAQSYDQCRMEMSFLLSSLQQQQQQHGVAGLSHVPGGLGGGAGGLQDHSSLLNALMEASFGLGSGGTSGDGSGAGGLRTPPQDFGGMSRAMSATPGGAGTTPDGSEHTGGTIGSGRAMSAGIPSLAELSPNHDSGGHGSHQQSPHHMGGGPGGNSLHALSPIGHHLLQQPPPPRSPRSSLMHPRSPQVRSNAAAAAAAANGRQISETGSSCSMSRGDSGALPLMWGAPGGTVLLQQEGAQHDGPMGGGGGHGGGHASGAGHASAFACHAAQQGGGSAHAVVPPGAQSSLEGLLPLLNSALAMNRQHQLHRNVQQQVAGARRASAGGGGGAAGSTATGSIQPPSPSVTDGAAPGLCTPPAAVPPLASPFSSSTCSLPSSVDFTLNAQVARLNRTDSRDDAPRIANNRCSSGGMTDTSVDPGGTTSPSNNHSASQVAAPGGGAALASAAVAQVLASLQAQGCTKEQLVVCLSQVLAALLAAP